MTTPGSGSRTKRRGYYLGTHREIADKKIAYYGMAVERARAGIGGHPLVCEDMLNKWLEYRLSHQRKGTLDEGAWL